MSTTRSVDPAATWRAGRRSSRWRTPARCRRRSPAAPRALPPRCLPPPRPRRRGAAAHRSSACRPDPRPRSRALRGGTRRRQGVAVVHARDAAAEQGDAPRVGTAPGASAKPLVRGVGGSVVARRRSRDAAAARGPTRAARRGHAAARRPGPAVSRCGSRSQRRSHPGRARRSAKPARVRTRISSYSTPRRAHLLAATGSRGNGPGAPGQRRRRQRAAGDRPRQRDASARRFGFVRVEPVGRTMRQAQAAHHASVGERQQAVAGRRRHWHRSRWHGLRPDRRGAGALRPPVAGCRRTWSSC